MQFCTCVLSRLCGACYSWVAVSYSVKSLQWERHERFRNIEDVLVGGTRNCYCCHECLPGITSGSRLRRRKSWKVPRGLTIVIFNFETRLYIIWKTNITEMFISYEKVSMNITIKHMYYLTHCVYVVARVYALSKSIEWLKSVHIIERNLQFAKCTSLFHQ